MSRLFSWWPAFSSDGSLFRTTDYNDARQGRQSSLLSTVLLGCDGLAPSDLDLLILNGAVIDSSGVLSSQTNVGVRGAMITWISEHEAQAADTLDDMGLVVATGFIELIGNLILRRPAWAHREWKVSSPGRRMSSYMET